ncbi:MAG: GNAT family N-acetyltransferase [Spirochaetia bacterium]|jgi:L-amino acid N-acyltransferase YncA
MLDYTLVTTKATYRLLNPQDLPIFLRLVQAERAERRDAPPFDLQKVLATVKELQPARGRGSVYVFERERKLVGYCILVNCWSSEQCGTVLVADELYVVPDQRAEEIGADFLTLLLKVAPEGTTSIRIEVSRGSRRSAAPFAKLGFRESGKSALSMRITRT